MLICFSKRSTVCIEGLVLIYSTNWLSAHQCVNNDTCMHMSLLASAIVSWVFMILHNLLSMWVMSPCNTMGIVFFNSCCCAVYFANVISDNDAHHSSNLQMLMTHVCILINKHYHLSGTMKAVHNIKLIGDSFLSLAECPGEVSLVWGWDSTELENIPLLPFVEYHLRYH